MFLLSHTECDRNRQSTIHRSTCTCIYVRTWRGDEGRGGKKGEREGGRGVDVFRCMQTIGLGVEATSAGENESSQM